MRVVDDWSEYEAQRLYHTGRLVLPTGRAKKEESPMNGVTIVSGALIPESRDGQYEATHDKARRFLWSLTNASPRTFDWPKATRVDDVKTLYTGTDDVDTFHVHLVEDTPVDVVEPYLARWLQALPSTVTHVRVAQVGSDVYAWPVALAGTL